MKRQPADYFAFIVGLFLLVEGIWGFFSPVVFGVLTTNTLHAIIHVVLGLVGMGIGYKEMARGYCWFLGALLLIVGLLRFIPGADKLVINLLNVNVAVAFLNTGIGVAALLVAGLSHNKKVGTA